MEIANVGKILVAAKIENLRDLFEVEKGALPADEVRKVEVLDALVDTGASTLCLPRRFIQQLGLKAFRHRTARTPGGTVSLGMYSIVRLTVQGRECNLDVAEVPDDCPVLVGQIPLEMLDFVVDPSGQRLIGNPEHGGEQMLEIFGYFNPPCST